MKKGHTQVRRSHASMGVYRSRTEAAELRRRVLDAWAAGEHGDWIAHAHGITRKYVDTIVRRARSEPDDRAVLRKVTVCARKSKAEYDEVRAAVIAARSNKVQVTAVATMLNVSRHYVNGVVNRTRRAGKTPG